MGHMAQLGRQRDVHGMCMATQPRVLLKQGDMSLVPQVVRGGQSRDAAANNRDAFGHFRAPWHMPENEGSVNIDLDKPVKTIIIPS